MRPAGGVFLALLASIVMPAGGQDPADAHRSPVAKVAAPPSKADRKDILSEMWQRGVLGPDMNQWSPDDLRLLERIRKAEAAGAIDDLKARLRTLKDLAVEAALPGAPSKRFVLTRAGYDRYLFARSQDALAYFERKGADAKWAFRLEDMEGRALFSGGLLTEAGNAVYRRVLVGMPVFWKSPTGEVFGTRRPAGQQAPPAPRPPASAAPAPEAPRQGTAPVQPGVGDAAGD
ncbi:MAG: hypothetical protein HY927_16660 [Elusimicrobia bacterium]|nr:hypothetical protein [Elusimicrobiota bacterium]